MTDRHARMLTAGVLVVGVAVSTSAANPDFHTVGFGLAFFACAACAFAIHNSWQDERRGQ